MKKHWCYFAFLMLYAAGLWGQDVRSVHIASSPPGIPIVVDGKLYETGAATLLWPAGSKHCITGDLTQRMDAVWVYPPDGTRYTFGGVTTNLGGISACPFTADRELTHITVGFVVEHRLILSYFDCGPDKQRCQSPGTVFVNGDRNIENKEYWFGHGTPIHVEAYPHSGYIFTGWAPLINQPRSNAYIYSFVLNEPQVLSPLFRSARPVDVTIESSPPGLQVLADRTTVLTPIRLEWGWDTVHALGVNPIQYDSKGRLWIFDSWSDGGAVNHEYKMEPGQSPLTITARFVPGANITFLTSPPGLSLTIDGRQNWKNYTFQWAAGTVHAIAAPAEQTDAQGRTYVFDSWANGEAAAHQFTVEAAPDEVRVMAIYKPVSRINITSSPSGLPIEVDGAECKTPCVMTREPGAQVRVSAPAAVPNGEGTRLAFQRWSDSSSAVRSLTATPEQQNLTAVYRQENRLTLASDPPDSGVWRIEPASPDGYYDSQMQVSVVLDPAPGFRFVQWEGDLSGVRSSGILNMSAPRTVRARMKTVPWIGPGAVRNAAAETPEESVAPGSIISIYGLNLASSLEIGPGSPLVQTLAGVTVRIGDRLLPLFFASPEQINAQLPSDLDEGPQILTVQPQGQPAVKATFNVCRNAPGLFNQRIEDRSFVLALRENGTVTSSENPAKRGEIVTLLGTGLGPYRRTPLDGFAMPETPDFHLADPVEVLLGETVLQPLYSGVSKQGVGLNAVKFRVGEAVPSATHELKIRVNGRESNTALLSID